MNKISIFFLCMILPLSNVFVFTNLPIVCTEPISTYINDISPYWQDAVPEVEIHATISGPIDNITLYYRYSSNNASWGSWTKWNGINNPREDYPWVWTFYSPNGNGYYEFYSIGANNSVYETAPSVADARCHLRYSAWTRFGYQYVGCFAETLEWFHGSNFTCLSNGTADNITLWIEHYWESSSHMNVSCAIYSNDRKNKIAQTEEKDIDYYYQGWVTFNFTGEPSLVEDTQYWICTLADDGYCRYDTNDSYDLIGENVKYSNTFPKDVSSYNIYPNNVLSIYCRYTEYTHNNPPNVPSKPSGQIKGKIGENYTYTTSTTDPDRNQLYYKWNWGDGTYSGWIGPYISGEFVNECHSWTKKGNYNIKVKAKDILGIESDWSDPLAIRMPKTDPTANYIEVFYLYIGKIRNLTIIEDENREYYQ